MDVQDQTSKHTIPSGGHENHGVHLCHRCGWPFPNPHPSARHRRAHKKICGTVEGYTTLIDSQVVSDDEHHLDDEKDNTPSPTIEKTKSIGGDSGETGRRVGRSEEDMFSDAVTEFPDSGSAEDRSASNKTLDRDLFFSFKDAENDGTNEVVNVPIKISKVDDTLEVSEKIDAKKIEETEKTTSCDLSEAELEKISDDLVKNGVNEPTHVFQSQEGESIDLVKLEEEKEEETRTKENATIVEEINDAEVETSEVSKMTSEVSEMSKTTPEVSEMSKTTHEVSAITADAVSEEIKKFESEGECLLEEVKESEVGQSVSVLTEKENLEAPILEKCSEEQISEVAKEPKSTSTEKDNLCAPKLENCSTEQIQEVFKEPELVLLPETENLGASKLENSSNENTHEVIEESDSVLIEKEDVAAPKLETCSKEQIQEVINEPESVLTEKEDLDALKSEKHLIEQAREVLEKPDVVLTEKENLGAPESGKCSNDQTQEVLEKPDTVLSETDNLGASDSEKLPKDNTLEVVEEPKATLTEKEDLGSADSEKCSNNHTQEVIEKPNTVLIEKEDLEVPNMVIVEEPKSTLTEKENHGETESEKCLNNHTQEVLEKPNTDLAEKENLEAPNMVIVEEPKSTLTQKENLGELESEKCLNNHTQEVLEKSNTVLAEKENLEAPNMVIVEEPMSTLTEKENLGELESEKCLNNHTQEVSEKPDTVFTEKENLEAPNMGIVEEPKSTLTEKENLGEPQSENCSNFHTQEAIGNPKVENKTEVVADVSFETITPKDSGVDLAVDSSSRNSVEANWGSVSVLSTASIDAETLHATDKSKVNSDKPVASADVYEPPSFMTLVEPENKDQKPEGQKGQQPPKPEAGWFPTVTNVNNESEGRKRNEEVIAKVTNWSTGKHSTPLKSLLGEAKSPTAKKAETVVHKDEDGTEKAGLPLTEAPVVNNHESLASPPKLIEDGKKGKKGKGRSSWVPFVCCSSVNVVN